jgi:hypothetical protein
MNDKKQEETVYCCVKNCQKEIPKNEAIVINGKYFCSICGVAFYRSSLNI